MFCASCGEETPGDLAGAPPPCARCGADPRLGGRFSLVGVLGRGAAGTTWRAVGPDGGAVAVKEVVVRRDAAKAIALAEREAAVLRQLDHPQIPRFVAHVETASGRARHLWLVQALVDGADLRAELADRRWSEDEVLALLADLCGPLAYLHGRSPPVVHRDLKPGNVLRGRDGRYHLVDFGSVRDALAGDLGGSTVAGTFGYMAPEQFAGEATPRSDLYGLGALAVALLAREEPARLQSPDRTVRWRDRVALSPGAGALLDALLAADPADRPRSAEAVAARIASLRASAAAPSGDGGWRPDAAGRGAFAHRDRGPAAAGAVPPPGGPGWAADPGPRAPAGAASGPRPVRERGAPDEPEPFPELPAAPDPGAPSPRRRRRGPSDATVSVALLVLLAVAIGGVTVTRAPPRPPPAPVVHAAAVWPVLPAGGLAGLAPVTCEATAGLVAECPRAFRPAAAVVSAKGSGRWRWDPTGVRAEDVEAATTRVALRPSPPGATRWEDDLPLRAEGVAGPWPAVGTPVVEVRCRADLVVDTDGRVASARVAECPRPYHDAVRRLLEGRVYDAPPEPVLVRSTVLLTPP